MAEPPVWLPIITLVEKLRRTSEGAAGCLADHLAGLPGQPEDYCQLNTTERLQAAFTVVASSAEEEEERVEELIKEHVEDNPPLDDPSIGFRRAIMARHELERQVWYRSLAAQLSGEAAQRKREECESLFADSLTLASPGESHDAQMPQRMDLRTPERPLTAVRGLEPPTPPRQRAEKKRQPPKGPWKVRQAE